MFAIAAGHSSGTKASGDVEKVLQVASGCKHFIGFGDPEGLLATLEQDEG